MDPRPPVVVIGGGTSGSIVSRILADTTDIPVTVVEAGGRTDDDAPRFLDGLSDDVLWPGMPMPQARALGGGSAVNGMVLSGPVPQWLEGLTRVAREGEMGSVSRALVAAGGRPTRLWWNNGRWNPARSMLHVEEEGRLRLVHGTAERIVVENGAARAVVVDGSEIECSHVVMCAGALLTPALLLASGAGDAVGEGLQNHPTVTFTVQRTDGDVGRFDATAVRETDSGRAKGLMVAFERVSADDPSRAMFTVSLMNPVSRGRVTTAGADFALLSDRRDVVAMEVVLESARAVVRNAGFTESTESSVHPVSHASSSCARSVDAFGRLAGYANITVADASILPWVPEDTPAASVTMVARRVATALGEALT